MPDGDSDYQFARFSGAAPLPPDAQGRPRGRYLASGELVTAVNTSLAAELPLLVTGEPGTGKTSLAEAVAADLGLGEILSFHTRSDHRARDLLYRFDAVRRFYDAQVQDERAKTIDNYVQLEALGTAICSSKQRVVLIDEIDKASRDFPNDLLNVIDRMEFTVDETGKKYPGEGSVYRPIVIITSNRERQLPEPFLRRVVFHYIEFPGFDQLVSIVKAHFDGPERERAAALAEPAVKQLLQLRTTFASRLSRLPATAELLAWVLVHLRAKVDPQALAAVKQPGELQHLGVLLKSYDDLQLVRGGA